MPVPAGTRPNAPVRCPACDQAFVPPWLRVQVVEGDEDDEPYDLETAEAYSVTKPAGKKVRPKSRQSGTVIVRFTIDARGQVLSSEIAKSSGSKVLDAAALASIAKASPFPPMPEGWSGEPFVITVPFMYRVN